MGYTYSIIWYGIRNAGLQHSNRARRKMPPLLVHGHAAFLAYPTSPALLEAGDQTQGIFLHQIVGQVGLEARG